MRKSLYFIIIFFGFFLSFPLFAEEDGMGEALGFDFYSKIDEGTYRVLQKTVSKKLESTPTLGKFGEECLKDELLLQGVETTPEILDDITNMNYAKLSEAIAKNLGSKGSLSVETFQQITLCLSLKYQKIRSDAERENNARQQISYLGLYMDGDKNNSEYDIISDIDKINSILFSIDIKYSGTPNRASKSYSDYLKNKLIPPLFPPSPPSTNTSSQNNSNNTTTPSTPPTATPDTQAPPPDTRDILGEICRVNNSPISVDDLMDESFARELGNVIADGDGGSTNNNGYTPPVGNSDPSMNTDGTSQTGRLSNKDDFFQKIPCEGFFCIDVKFIPGSQNLLIGGKNISIEGILDKSTQHLDPISKSALNYQVMTNNAGSNPKKGLSLVGTFAGLKVYLANKPQVTRRDKRDATPEREAAELQDIQNCALASAGLPIDEARGRSIGGAGFVASSVATTENVDNTRIPLGPQETAELARYANCVEGHMQSGRKSYYDSFSTDVTEIQAYTMGMIQEIKEIMVILTAMNSKDSK